MQSRSFSPQPSKVPVLAQKLIPQQPGPPKVQDWPQGMQLSQVQVPGVVQVPALPSGSLQWSVSQQVSVVPSKVQPTSRVAQAPQTPPLQSRPRQQSADVAQLPLTGEQESQRQVVAPSGQAVPSSSMQVRAGVVSQQLAVVVQLPNWFLQVGGSLQTPSRQASVERQQGLLPSQAAPLATQLLTAWQVPLVAPGAMSHERPEQQSPSIVQLPPPLTQGGAQTPPTQLLEQQSLATEQASPFRLQETGTSQVKSLGKASAWS